MSTAIANNRVGARLTLEHHPTHPIAAMFDQLDKVDQARVEAYIVSILESEKYNDQKKKRHA